MVTAMVSPIPLSSAIEEEFRELLESVREAGRSPGPDPDCAAACALLARHLAVRGYFLSAIM